MLENKPKIAIFGGSFDPPHLGHLRLAQALCNQNLVEQVLFVPAYCQPLKQGLESSSFSHRCAMLELLLKGDSRFSISTIESERQGPSYTYDTLKSLTLRMPQTHLFFLMGTDCLETLFKWYRAKELVTEYQFIIYPRPNYQPNFSLLTVQFGKDLANKLLKAVVDLPTLDLSSTALRNKIRMGQTISSETSLSVAEYITQHQLYR